MENQIKKVLFLGSRDSELVKSIQTILANRPDVTVAVMDRADLNNAEDRTKEKVIKWQEKDKMSSYITNPINLKLAVKKGTDLYEHLKEHKAIESFTTIMNATGVEMVDMSNLQIEAIREKARNGWDGWFTLKDAVDATTLSYKTAKEVLDMLYAFGFSAFREVGGQTQFTIFLNTEMQLEYVALLMKEKHDDLKELEFANKALKGKLKMEQQAALTAANEASASTEVAKPKEKLSRKREKVN